MRLLRYDNITREILQVLLQSETTKNAEYEASLEDLFIALWRD